MNGNLASSPIKNNFLPIIDRPLFRALWHDTMITRSQH
jgi:hypothetical protein